MTKKSSPGRIGTAQEREIALMHVLNGVLERIFSTFAHSVAQDILIMRIDLQEIGTLLAKNQTNRDNAATHVERAQLALENISQKTRSFFDQVPDLIWYHPIDIKKTIDKQVILTKKLSREDISVETVYHSANLIVFGSALIGEHIFNILDNSRHAIDQKLSDKNISEGVVKIIVKDDMNKSTADHQKYISIIVIDNGGGVSENLLRYVGQFGFTTKSSRGSGFGLAAARNYFESIGGGMSWTNSDNGFVVTMKVPVFDKTFHEKVLLSWKL